MSPDRVIAGVVYPSDARAGLELGRTVGGRVIAAMKLHGQKWAGKEFGESRIWAGIHFRSDIDAGYDIGRRVGAAVIERARRDGAE